MVKIKRRYFNNFSIMGIVNAQELGINEIYWKA